MIGSPTPKFFDFVTQILVYISNINKADKNKNNEEALEAINAATIADENLIISIYRRNATNLKAVGLEGKTSDEVTGIHIEGNNKWRQSSRTRPRIRTL